MSRRVQCARRAREVLVGAAAMTVAMMVLLSAQIPASADTPDLTGKVIVLDPGHQLGNTNPAFAKQMSATKFNGDIVKGCNTSGTATNAGLPEATFTWKVANDLADALRAQGATVILTRPGNSYHLWGPCVWNRAEVANQAKADAFVSIHADGAAAGGRGFHVITAAAIPGWTHDRPSADAKLATAMVAGMTAAGATPTTYLSAPLVRRKDETTLNFNSRPAVMVEVGNMRNPRDAALMSSAAGQHQYASWLLAGLNRYFAG